MTPIHLRSLLGNAGLGLAIGCTLLAVKQLIQTSGLFVIGVSRDLITGASLMTYPSFFSGFPPLDFIVYVLCAFALLAAYHGLVRADAHDAPIPRLAGTMFACLGGVIGALFTTMSGWYVGLQAFIAFGALGIIAGIVFIAAARGIIWAGRALDPWLQRLFVRGGSHG